MDIGIKLFVSLVVTSLITCGLGLATIDNNEHQAILKKAIVIQGFAMCANALYLIWAV